MYSRRLVALLAFPVLAIGGWVFAQPKSPPAEPPAAGKTTAAHPAWEYKALARFKVEDLAPKGAEDRLTDGLNVLGSEGWELVAIDSAAPPQRAVYTFKRPRGRTVRAESKGAPPAAENKDELIHIFKMKFASAPEMVTILKELSLAKDGRSLRFTSDQRTNTVIVVALEKEQVEVARLLAELDTPGEERPAQKGGGK